MLKIESKIKIYKLPDWNGVSYGRIQMSSRKLASLVGQERKILVYVLEDNEQFIDQPEITVKRKELFCKFCQVLYCDVDLQVCPSCGHNLIVKS